MGAMMPVEVAANRALYAPDAESAVIACLLHSPKAVNAVAGLTEDDFFSLDGRRCFRAARVLVSKGMPVDLVTLDDELHHQYAQVEADSAANYALSGIRGAAGWNVEYYARAVKEAAVRRKLVGIADDLSKLAADSTEDVEATIDSARAQLRDMIVTGSTWMPMQDVMLAAYDWLDNKSAGRIRSTSTGIRVIDRATGGLFPGEMTIVGARPSVGKTAFGLQLAIAAAKSNAKVCFISMEMSPEQMGNRVLSREAGVDGEKLRNAVLNDNDWELISEAMSVCSDLPISFMHGTATIENIRSEIQRKVELDECDLVVIDYLQLIRTKRRIEKEYERLGYVSRMLKLMTLDFKIPIVVLAQVRRQNAGGKSRCPALDELRGSGDMEQDADNVIFLHRPDDPDDPTVDEADSSMFWTMKKAGYDYMVFNVAKQRQGRVGTLTAGFNAARMRYVDFDRDRG